VGSSSLQLISYHFGSRLDEILNRSVQFRACIVVLSLVAAAVSVFQPDHTRTGPFYHPKTEPLIITPGKTNGDPPSDAIVLFDGKDISRWRSIREGSEVKWQVRGGYLEVVPRPVTLLPEKSSVIANYTSNGPRGGIEGEGQGRGNSGIFLMQRYEVQVLDSYQNKTYFHGQAGAIYKQYAPWSTQVVRPVHGKVRHHLQSSEVR